jgi:S-formylglutathione hydrolase FrmB
MAVCEIHTNNDNVLNKMMSVTVILPEGVHLGPFPVFYLLHGLSDDHTAWVRKTSIERYVQDLPLIVVMPNGERSFYTDARDDPYGAFETYIVHDLIGFVDRVFRTIPTNEGRVIGGLSMGGYGALKLALKHPDLFRAAVSHSGAVARGTDPLRADDEWLRQFIPIFGEKPGGGPEDIFALAEHADRGTLPAMRIDCGVDDDLIETNRRLHRHLDALGVAHEYAEYPGGHTWEYWDTHVQEAIAFFARELGLRPAEVPGTHATPESSDV